MLCSSMLCSFPCFSVTPNLILKGHLGPDDRRSEQGELDPRELNPSSSFVSPSIPGLGQGET